MKRYGVFICIHCRNAFSKESKVGRTRCPRCDRPLNLKNLFPVITTDDLAVAAEGVRHANLNNLAGTKSEGIRESIIAERKKADIPAGRYARLLSMLDAGREYSEAELTHILGDAAGDLISAALEKGDIYEPRPGSYRLLE